MKNILLIVGVLILATGCNIASDPGRVYSPQTNLTFQELPQPVQHSIKSEPFDSAISRITEFGKSEQRYYQVDLLDGTDRRYKPDGSTTYGGIL